MIRRAVRAVAVVLVLLAVVAVGRPAAAKTTVIGPSAASSVVTSNADGRLEIFRTGPQGQVEHAWQLTPGGTWSKWDTLPGATAVGVPGAVIQNLDGRLEVFVATEGGAFGAGIIHAWQLTPGGSWSNWDALLPGDYESATVGRNADGRLQLFAQENTDEPVTILTMNQQCAGCAWGSSGPLTNPPVTESWGWLTTWLDPTGRLNLLSFAVGRGGTWYGQAAPGGAFVEVNAPLPEPPNPAFSQPLANVQNVDGTLVVFLVDEGGQVWSAAQTGVSLPFGAWEEVGAVLPPGGASIVASANADGRFELFSSNFTTGVMSHTWQTSPGGSWASHWEDFHGTLVQPFTLAAILNADGRLEVFIANDDNRYFNAYQEHPGRGPWSHVRWFN